MKTRILTFVLHLSMAILALAGTHVAFAENCTKANENKQSLLNTAGHGCYDACLNVSPNCQQGCWNLCN